MSPFDINPDNDAGHALDQDDLIAFHLHDLPSSQERAVRRVLRTRPDLQAESIAIASTLRAFPKHEAALPLDAAVLDRNWLALRNSLPILAPTAAAPFSFFPRWIFPTLAASALVATAIILTLHHKQHTSPSALATNHAPSSASAASPATTATPHFVPFADPYPPFSAPHRSSVTHRLSRIHATPPQLLPSAAVSSNPSATNAQPPQPNPSSPSATSPSNASIAVTQQSQSAPTPLTPTFTPIIQTRGYGRPRDRHTTDVTLAVIGAFTPDRSFTSLASTVTGYFTQETTPSVGALASFHQQLRPWIGYRLTGAYSEPTFQDIYSTSGNSKSGNIIDEHAYEASLTYVVQGPRHHRLSTSAEVGAGVLAFRHENPKLSAVPVSNANRPTGIFGVAAEFALNQHWAIHTGYRAVLYRAPSAYPIYGSSIPPAPNNFTLSNEPVLGLTYRFHSAYE